MTQFQPEPIRMKTLVIEDSSSNRKILCHHIEKMGITPIPAETGSLGVDLIARYGGEEFAAVLPETSLGGALFVAERMKQTIDQLGLANTGSIFGHITASFGIASATPLPAPNPPAGMHGVTDLLSPDAPPEASPLALLDAADRALYKAKRSGRNRVCRASSLDTAPC